MGFKWNWVPPYEWSISLSVVLKAKEINFQYQWAGSSKAGKVSKKYDKKKIEYFILALKITVCTWKRNWKQL